jgi:2-methylaconitate cis-trans-isomerase PrpF
VIGSPDRYGKHTDGMGGATSSTSKVVILSKSARADCDIDYLFGQVAIDQPLVDWSGNCGNLSAAVGPFAISTGLIDAPADGTATVRIWQANIRKKIVSHVPRRDATIQARRSQCKRDLCHTAFHGCHLFLSCSYFE